MTNELKSRMNQLLKKVAPKSAWSIALITDQHHSKNRLTSFLSMSRPERVILYTNTQGHCCMKAGTPAESVKHPLKRKIKSGRPLNKHTVPHRWLNEISHFKASIMRQVMKSVKQFVAHLTRRTECGDVAGHLSAPLLNGRPNMPSSYKGDNREVDYP